MPQVKTFWIIAIATALLAALYLLFKYLNAAKKVKMLEAELKVKNILVMQAQIQPHFIYNTLGTIQRMCLKDPEQASELVKDFSLYLQGNFREADSMNLIPLAEELNHVGHYVNILKARFPDINVVYDIKAAEFLLPALSVQPLVENAIKHGLMGLESGGTVEICAYETPPHFCVEVKDNGAGFDTSLAMDEKRHVGLRNVRSRLKEMVNGELMIESQIGAGTRALILIPKE